jgi:hypothetical protein
MSGVEKDKAIVGSELGDIVREFVVKPVLRHILVGPKSDILCRNFHLIDKHILHGSCIGNREGHLPYV